MQQSRFRGGAWTSHAALLFYLLILLSISGVCVGDTAAVLDDGRDAMKDHMYSRRRLEQRSASIQKDTCKFDVAYTISSITRSKFDATIIVENNREVASPIQLVYRYPDADKVDVEFVTGGVLVSKSNGTLVPVRIKTLDSVSSNQDVNIGSSVKFINLNGGNGPSPYTRLAIQDLNVNGVQCEALREKTLAYSKCYDAISFFQSFNGRPPPTNAGIEECSMSFCCGMVTMPEVDVIEAVPTPEPAVENTTASTWDTGKVVSDDTKEQLEPTGAEEQQVVSEEDKETDGKPNQGADTEQQTSDISPPQPASTLNEEKGTAGSQESSDGGSGNSTALIGAAVGIAVALAAIVVISFFVIRARRNRRVQDQNQPSADGSGSKRSQGSRPQLSLKSTNTTVRTGSSMFSRGASIPLTGGRSVRNLSMAQKSATTTTTTNGCSTCTTSTPHEVDEDQILTPIDTLPDDLPEDVILHEQLGAGAFGTVFKGEWGGHTVAVKVLQTAYTSNSRELDSFRQEIAVLSGLRHPNIIAFLAACTIPPDICIIEELAENGSLHGRLHGPSGSSNRCRPMPIKDVIQVAIDVAQAMVYLHPNIVHRDLKSQNVLLDADGRAKVCDFGIAKFKDRTFVSTVNGQAGTPAYMAPELFDGVNATEKVDVYSFAILLWECLTGKVPWGHVPSPMQIIYYVGVLNQRPKMPSAVPEDIKSLIQECWTSNPKNRPSFEDILARLMPMKCAMSGDDDTVMTLPCEDEELSQSSTSSRKSSEQLSDSTVAEAKKIRTHPLPASPSNDNTF